MKSSIVHTIPLRQRAEVTHGYGYKVLYHRSDIMPCNKIKKPLVVYRFSRKVKNMTSTTMFRTK